MTNRQPKLHIFTTGILVFPYKHGPSQEFSVSVSNTCTFFPGLGSKYRSPAWCLSFSPSVSPPVLAHTSLLLFLCSQPATRHRHLGSITTATTVLTSLLASSWCPMTVKGPNCTAGWCESWTSPFPATWLEERPPSRPSTWVCPTRQLPMAAGLRHFPPPSPWRLHLRFSQCCFFDVVGTDVTFQLSPFLIPLLQTVTHPSTVCDPVPCFVLLHNTCYLATCQVFDSLLSMIWLPTPESTHHQGRKVFRFTPGCGHSRAWLRAGAEYTCV